MMNHVDDYSEDVTLMHGPRFSAERLDRKRSLRTKADEKKYFEERQRKLDTQNRPEIVSDIFKNVVIYFTGFTQDASVLDMRRKVLALSGSIRMMFYPGQTTHIVCTTLAGAKVGAMLRRIRSSSKRVIHVVRPEWILKCFDLKKKVPERDFSLLLPNNGSFLDSFVIQQAAPGEDAHDDIEIDLDADDQTEGTDAKEQVSHDHHPLKSILARNTKQAKQATQQNSSSLLQSLREKVQRSTTSITSLPQFKKTTAMPPLPAGGNKMRTPSQLGLVEVPKGQRTKTRL